MAVTPARSRNSAALPSASPPLPGAVRPGSGSPLTPAGTGAAAARRFSYAAILERTSARAGSFPAAILHAGSQSVGRKVIQEHRHWARSWPPF